MPIPRRGDIFWAPRDKKRPVLVVSNDARNQFSNSVVVAAITTTQPRKAYPSTVRLEVDRPLKRESYVTCGSLYTMLKDDLLDFAGELSPDQIAAVDRAIKDALGLQIG